jgi:chemotaxis signal transduction protein
MPSAQHNWNEIRARLEYIRGILEREGNPSPEAVARVWDERARRYAAGTEAFHAGDGAGDGNAVLVFRLGPNRYGVPVSAVREVLPNARIAPVPGAPANVAGLIQVRGEIRPVYDLSQWMGTQSAPSPPSNDGDTVILLSAVQRDFGIRVDGPEEIRSWLPAERARAGESPWVKSVTDDLVSILDMESELWGRKT